MLINLSTIVPPKTSTYPSRERFSSLKGNEKQKNFTPTPKNKNWWYPKIVAPETSGENLRFCSAKSGELFFLKVKKLKSVFDLRNIPSG